MPVSRYIKNGISFFIYSNLFIAFCVCAYTAKTTLLLYGNNGSPLVNSFVFSATLLFYCFHRVNKIKFLTPGENMEERNNWMSGHRPVYYTFIILCSITLLVELFFMPLRAWVVFIPVGILGVGYTFPIIPSKKGMKRLRDIYWLKIVWISLAFSWLTTFLPVIFIEPVSTLLKPSALFIFCRSFLFLFAVCMPFDIRDMQFDKQRGVNTLPVSIGAKTSTYISITVLLIFISLVCTQFLYFGLDFKVATALFISAFLTIALLPLANKKRPAVLFPLLYDGSMLVQWILVLLFTHF
ncbi:MAG TPA: UbiA family prenyltransferase [Bacteroidia bacterium]|jgi:4-hydroxybenzoate polyprenyltransferase|nr:UbiA family prenyltransferase [Bacteroidia bacterium]